MTSQPSMGAVVACLKDSERATGLDLDMVHKYAAYWEQARLLYAPFESTTTLKSGNADVYDNEIPGGQYTNLQFQAFSLGLGSQFEQIKKAYIEANALLGDIIKVTPSSKVVGDLAQFMVQNKLTPDDVKQRAGDLSFPSSVINFFQGYIGIPPGGFPEPLRTKMLKGLKTVEGRPGETMPPLNFDTLQKSLVDEFGQQNINEEDVMSAALYPKVAQDYFRHRDRFGPVDKLDTRTFFIGPKVTESLEVEIDTGKTLEIKVLALGNLNKTAGEREVFFELNGQPRAVMVEDKSARKEAHIHPKADKSVKGSVGAPMLGEILEVRKLGVFFLPRILYELILFVCLYK